jgi:hypothetical protein
MRIISSFRDYYDSAMSFGTDKNIVYRREPEEFMVGRGGKAAMADIKPIVDIADGLRAMDIALRARSTKQGRPQAAVLSQPMVVLVAGKVYTGIRIGTLPASNGMSESRPRWLRHSWDVSESIGLLSEYGYGLQSKSWFSEKTLKQEIEEFYAHDGSDRMQKACVREKIVVALYTHESGMSKFVVNAPLSPVRFFERMDAWTMFQEIDMFISGMLPASSNETVEVSDRSKIAKHGFDEWSFRKMKEGKRRA